MCRCTMMGLFVVVLLGCVMGTAIAEETVKNSISDGGFETARELIEQGRTFVHHAVKRFMVILPAIFFKLGIAFTLLIIVSLVAVNNGVIGFLILVVGLSSVLARLQQAQTPHVHPVPLIAPPPAWPHHFIDRSDTSPPVYSKPAMDYKPSYSKVHYSNQMMDRSDAANYAAQVQRLNDLLQMQQRNAQVTPVYGNTEVVYNGYAKTS